MDTMLALQEALGGRYWLDRGLGRGGMGIVYLAWEPALERRVALKILPLPADPGRFDQVLERSETCVRRGRERLEASSAMGARDGESPSSRHSAFVRSLERQVVALEARLEKMRSAGLGADGGASLAADVTAAVALCDMVESLLEAGELLG